MKYNSDYLLYKDIICLIISVFMSILSIETHFVSFFACINKFVDLIASFIKLSILCKTIAYRFNKLLFVLSNSKPK